MNTLTNEQVAAVKGRGFLRNRGTDCFSGRLVPRGCVFSAEDLQVVAEIASRFGNGRVAFTSRLTAEIVGIPYDRIDDAVAFAEAHGLHFGGTGAKVRPVTACKGTTCVFGTFDTQGLAAQIHDAFYIGWNGVSLPHKFKIGVGGCPNSCMKPSLNDFGVQGQRVPGGEVRFRIFVGGTWGKTTRMGTPLSRLVTQDEVLPLLEKTLLWYRENAYAKERLGHAVDRVGVEALETALFEGDLLERREAILAAPIATAP